MKIKIRSYNSATFTSGVRPSGGYDYKSPEGTLWNVDTVEGNKVGTWEVVD
jgi:hypothetical protein